MPTIRDVALRANVSIATVSRVINNSAKVSPAVKEAVLKAQKELNFSPNANARALAQRESNTIGMVVSDVSDPYFATAIRSCDDAIQASGFNLLIAQGHHDAEREKRAIDSLISYKCRGLVVHALALNDDIMRDYLDRVDSMVLINRVIKGYEERCLNCDNYAGECLAVGELIEKGHTKIAFINSSHQILDASERLQGYVDTLTKYHLKFDPNLVAEAPPSIEGGSQATKSLLAKLKPGKDFTAIACYSDVMAIGAIPVLYSNGFTVPDDISITGFDNLYLSYCSWPALTTIDNPIKRMAEEAVNRAITLYSRNPLDPPHRLDVSLVRRDSVKDLNAKDTKKKKKST